MFGALLLPSPLVTAGVCARPCSRRRRPCLTSASTVATEGGSDVADEYDDDELDLQLLDEALRRQRTRDVGGERESTIGNGIARLIFDNLREPQVPLVGRSEDGRNWEQQGLAGPSKPLSSLPERTERGGAHGSQSPLEISRFLHATSSSELATVRKFASLSSFAYLLSSVTEGSLARSHKLRLVTTSLAHKAAEAADSAAALAGGLRPLDRRWLAEALLCAPAQPPPRPSPPSTALAKASQEAAESASATLLPAPTALLKYLPADVTDVTGAAEALEGALGPGTDALNKAVQDILSLATREVGAASRPALRLVSGSGRRAQVLVRRVGAAVGGTWRAGSSPSASESAGESFSRRSTRSYMANLASAVAPLVAAAAAGSGVAASTLAAAAGPLAVKAAAGSSVAAQALGGMIDPIAAAAAAGGSAAGAALANITGNVAAAAAAAATRVGQAGGRGRALRAAARTLEAVKGSAVQVGEGAAAAALSAASAAGTFTPSSGSSSTAFCPCEWFVADDPGSATRVFVVQGSDSVASWRSNLAFDPVVFEHPSLNTKVHRGVYEASLALYDTLQPLIDEHLAKGGRRAKITFTGHSLGGSIATLLLLLLAHRRPQLLSEGRLEPVYTYGAPAIICDGCCGDGAEERASKRAADAAAAAAGPGGLAGAALAAAHFLEPLEGLLPANAFARPPPRGLLTMLGLPLDSVRNVMMHLDIVPRAFSCDYRLVQAWLSRLGGSFRDHACLQNGGGESWESVSMYVPIGKTLVLQPSEDVAAQHAMLPRGSGLYLLDDPSEPLWAAVGVPWALGGNGGGSDSEWWDSGLGGSERPPAARGGQGLVDARAALSALLNSPHPLDMLADVSAYGPQGTVSRYHNPFAYSLALKSEIRRRKGGTRVSVERLWTRTLGILPRPPKLPRLPKLPQLPQIPPTYW